MEVTGMMKDLPSQIHFKIDILGSLSTFREMAGGQMPRWLDMESLLDLHHPS